MKRVEPLLMTQAEFANTMRDLRKYKPFQVLQSYWLTVRQELCEQGKKKPSEGQWHKLDGFDIAVQAPEKWANFETDAVERARRRKKRQETPTGDLEE